MTRALRSWCGPSVVVLSGHRASCVLPRASSLTCTANVPALHDPVPLRDPTLLSGRRHCVQNRKRISLDNSSLEKVGRLGSGSGPCPAVPLSAVAESVSSRDDVSTFSSGAQPQGHGWECNAAKRSFESEHGTGSGKRSFESDYRASARSSGDAAPGRVHRRRRAGPWASPSGLSEAGQAAVLLQSSADVVAPVRRSQSFSDVGAGEVRRRRSPRPAPQASRQRPHRGSEPHADLAPRRSRSFSANTVHSSRPGGASPTVQLSQRALQSKCYQQPPSRGVATTEPLGGAEGSTAGSASSASRRGATSEAMQSFLYQSAVLSATTCSSVPEAAQRSSVEGGQAKRCSDGERWGGAPDDRSSAEVAHSSCDSPAVGSMDSQRSAPVTTLHTQSLWHRPAALRPGSSKQGTERRTDGSLRLSVERASSRQDSEASDQASAPVASRHASEATFQAPPATLNHVTASAPELTVSVGLRAQAACSLAARPVAGSMPAKAELPPMPPSAPAAAAPRGVGRPMQILVAEDNKINQLVVCKVLRVVVPNSTVKVVPDGEAALGAILTNSDLDLVLMDLHMPKMSGLEATKRVREVQPTRPLIVALTADTVAGIAQRCLDAGMNDYVTKPFSVHDMKRILALVPSRT